MSNKMIIRIIAGLLAVVALLCIASCASDSTGSTVETVEATLVFDDVDDGIYVEFSSKVDGDTAWFRTDDGKDINVLFLGIDMPETVKKSTEVSKYITGRLSNAEEIYLEYDPGAARKDAYDHVIAWVWIDGSLLEEELVSLGYADVADDDYMYTNLLYEAQEQAQADHVGIWS